MNQNAAALPLNHVFINEFWHDGDGHCSGRGGQNVLDLGVLKWCQKNNDVMYDQNTNF